jgi:hypothetical protein
LDLDDADADGETEESEPLVRAELFAEHEDGEAGGGEDLHLVRHLERRDVEVRCGDVLEVILDNVEDGGDGELPAVRREELGLEAGEARTPVFAGEREEVGGEGGGRGSRGGKVCRDAGVGRLGRGGVGGHVGWAEVAVTFLTAREKGVEMHVGGRAGEGTGRVEGHVVVYPFEGDDDGDGALEKLVEENSGGGRVSLGGSDGDSGVVHDDGEAGVLEGERDKARVEEGERWGSQLRSPRTRCFVVRLKQETGTYETYFNGRPRNMGSPPVSLPFNPPPAPAPTGPPPPTTGETLSSTNAEPISPPDPPAATPEGVMLRYWC